MPDKATFTIPNGPLLDSFRLLAVQGVSFADYAAAAEQLISEMVDSGVVDGWRGEPQITPEMIDAGEEAFCGYDPRFEGPRDVVAEIYRAMDAARRAAKSAPTPNPLNTP